MQDYLKGLCLTGVGSCNVLILEGAVAYDMVHCLQNKICQWGQRVDMPCILTASFAIAAHHARYCGALLNDTVHLPGCAVIFIPL